MWLKNVDQCLEKVLLNKASVSNQTLVNNILHFANDSHKMTSMYFRPHVINLSIVDLKFLLLVIYNDCLFPTILDTFCLINITIKNMLFFASLYLDGGHICRIHVYSCHTSWYKMQHDFKNERNHRFWKTAGKGMHHFVVSLQLCVKHKQQQK